MPIAFGATSLLMVGSAGIILLLGTAHLVLTFRGPKLHPRDPVLETAMREVSPVITRETTMWRAWIGFNASHSFGAMLFGLVWGYLALVRSEVLFDSPFLLGLGLVLLCGFLWLGVRYWFSVPRRGIAVATALYVASIVARIAA
jgi:hypothetical protein